ncbi:MAG: hypothetical protein K0U34_09185 [Alphaproteobacteria bacterium]|nr:hypothetical protein [Alphaproteobacteria bacterium]
MYRTLNPEKIVSTTATLKNRIDERFPGAGLGKVCAELLKVAEESKDRVKEISEPNYTLRLISAGILGLGMMLLVAIGSMIEFKSGSDNLFGVLEGIDAAFSILVLMGATAIFLWGLEGRWRRQKALEDLHALRSIIHVIDMHQLTKDPSAKSFVSISGGHEGDTPASPVRSLTPHQLTRYLDYCSEMLSLSAKVAALYAQGSGDAVVVDTASQLGQVTTNMAGKIWQKIELVHRLDQLARPKPAPGPAPKPAIAPPPEPPKTS